MQSSILLLILLGLTVGAYFLGRNRSVSVVGGPANARTLHSLPGYYGFYTALSAGLPALLVFGLWIALQSSYITDIVVADLPEAKRNLSEAELNLLVNDIRNSASGNIASSDDPDIEKAAAHLKDLETTGSTAKAVAVVALAIMGAFLAWRTINPELRARNRVEKTIMGLLIACSTIAVFTTVGIVLSVLWESLRFFESIPFFDFVFGLHWSPQIAIRADQVGSSGSFGAIPLVAGTMLISLIAMLVAVPIGLLAAIYLSEYASPQLRSIGKPVLEILAGVPTVVYGFFAALTVAPFIRGVGESMGLDASSESALAAGLVMGIMIIPFVSSLSDDVINAVPQSLRDAAYGLGATQSETIRQVILPAALPGIVGGVLLAASRAIGETMIVVMAAGQSANLTINPLESVTTVTVQIVTLLTGDQEFDSPKTLAAFALGLLLFTITLALNVFALHIVRKYREQYD